MFYESPCDILQAVTNIHIYLIIDFECVFVLFPVKYTHCPWKTNVRELLKKSRNKKVCRPTDECHHTSQLPIKHELIPVSVA